MTPQPLVVTHLPHIKPGETWPLADLRELRDDLDEHSLKLGPIESVFWTDAMKLGRKERDGHLDNYLQTLKNLRETFPEDDELVVTYNLMPLDWGRTSLAKLHPNGAKGLAYDHKTMEEMDLSKGLFLPGWSRHYEAEEFARLQEAYAEQGIDALWSNVEYNLKALIPQAASLGIRLAAHPNDPPWPYLGLPALLCNASDIRRLLTLYPNRSNAICFCTGSLSAEPENNITAMIREFAESIAWMHIRAVKTLGEKSFQEADHADSTANVDLLTVMRTLVEVGWKGVFRSDHGLDLLHESDTGTNGYPAIDRYVANKMLWAYGRALQLSK